MLNYGQRGRVQNRKKRSLTLILNLILPSIVFHNQICVFFKIFAALSFLRLSLFSKWGGNVSWTICLTISQIKAASPLILGPSYPPVCWKNTNTDTKIKWYLRPYIKIICGRFRIMTPLAFWDILTLIYEIFVHKCKETIEYLKK